jgi:phi13 family phage major tail protein
LNSHTKGTEPTYNAGMVACEMIGANLSITRNSNPLYADDTISEDDNSITAMSLEVTGNDLTEAVRCYMLGLKKVTTGSGDTAVDTYYDTDTAAPYVGFGYIRVKTLKGVKSYEGIWIYKAMFAEENENSATKGESIEWQTPTITGRAAGLMLNNVNYISFRKRALFTTFADAQTWLRTQANITA